MEFVLSDLAISSIDDGDGDIEFGVKFVERVSELGFWRKFFEFIYLFFEFIWACSGPWAWISEMNRSFRAPESQMLAAMKQRQQLRASMMREKEEELALFLEMKKREKERNDLLLNHSEEFDAPLGKQKNSIFWFATLNYRFSYYIIIF